jgi:phenylalanyl-tRNA synthetase alpha subunit
MNSISRKVFVCVIILALFSCISALKIAPKMILKGVNRSFSRSSRLFSVVEKVVDEPLKIALQSPHPYRNVTPAIIDKIGRNLHRNDKHPLGIIKAKIEEYMNEFYKEKGGTKFDIYDNLSPLVNTKNCFDDLRVGPDHPSRRQSDTYYVTDTEVLRTHTSAHQNTLISKGIKSFVCTGDVFRRDEIDSSHYPVFHQMEGVRIFDNSELPAGKICMYVCMWVCMYIYIFVYMCM